ncbi:MAG: hypothetical protein HC929_09265 [Leptolyngbyaceae cyanobacterium SM2_5_2]|nr:hypothetical protein [Leptolyngbyaceae cyanobacterium SM2_5_2]
MFEVEVVHLSLMSFIQPKLKFTVVIEQLLLRINPMQNLLIRRLAGFSLKLGLPSLTLVSLLGLTPSLAVAQLTTQTVSDQPEEVIIANIFRDIDRTIQDGRRTIDDATDLVDTITRPFEERAAAQRAEEERQLRELERIRLQEEREAAVRVAAEQRRQYFESLTPEQQQAYVAEQERLQQQQIDMISQFFLEALVSSSTQPDRGDYPQGMTRDEYYCYIDPNCGR